MKTDEMRQRSTEKQGKTTKSDSETANKQRNAVQTTAQARPHKKTIDSWTVQARRQSRGRSAGWLASRPAGRNNENGDEHRTKNNEIQQIRTSDHEKTDGDTDSDNENQQNCKNG